MKVSSLVAVGLAVALYAGLALAEEKTALKSGPQVGEELAGPFHPLNINGASAGKKFCLYCVNGDKPVAMVFARTPTKEVETLVKKLDAACEANKDAKLGSFVVFCSSEEGLEDKLKTMAKDADLKKVVLSIDNPAGPDGYKVAKDADVTVVLYVNRTAKANYAFEKGKLTDKDIETIVESTSKIVK
ncbi:MAG: hypothetical protein ACRC33_20465 [Gemmataceae bacterium]